MLPAPVSYRYAAVNIRLSTQLLTTYVFDISRKAYFTIIPDSNLKIPKRCVLVSRGCEIAHRAKHDRLNEGWLQFVATYNYERLKYTEKMPYLSENSDRTRHISTATILRTSSGRNIVHSITRLIYMSYSETQHNAADVFVHLPPLPFVRSVVL